MLLVAAVVFTAPALATPADAWTAEEMQAVYDLNLARRNPVLWGIEHGVDLSGIPARPPLAPNNLLAASAAFRAEDLAATGGDYGHRMSPPDSRWPNQVARDFGYPLPSWWSGDANYIEGYLGGAEVFPLANILSYSRYVDPDQVHLEHLLGSESFALHREIGFGFHQDGDELWWVWHTGYIEGGDPFITGAAFNDGNQNGVMDLGEGIPGVTVIADGRTATTNAGGGWAIQIPRGSYTVTASGGGFAGTSSAKVEVNSYNVGVDFISGDPAAIVVSYALCGGYMPTMLGTSGPDTIYGTSGRDIIYTGSGNDIVHAGSGNDVVCGDAGNDNLDGGTGRDYLYGDRGDDTLTGRSGSDRLYGGNGDDTLVGHRCNDRLYGGRGNDILSGRPGSDTLNGGSGTDTGDGGSGTDRCSNLDYQAGCEV